MNNSHKKLYNQNKEMKKEIILSIRQTRNNKLMKEFRKLNRILKIKSLKFKIKITLIHKLKQLKMRTKKYKI